MLQPVRTDDPNRHQKEYYRRKREERCAYQRAYWDAHRGAPACGRGAWRFVSSQQGTNAVQNLKTTVLS